MRNIFNLTLFVFLIGLLLLFVCDQFFIVQIALTFCGALIFVLILHHFEIIDKKSQPNFLNLGFYRHFCFILLRNFIFSVDLLLSIAFDRGKIRPLIYKIKLPNSKDQKQLLINTINLSSGLLLVENRGDIYVIHALNDKYFKDLEIVKLNKDLAHIDEDEIV